MKLNAIIEAMDSQKFKKHEMGWEVDLGDGFSAVIFDDGAKSKRGKKIGWSPGWAAHLMRNGKPVVLNDGGHGTRQQALDQAKANMAKIKEREARTGK